MEQRKAIADGQHLHAVILIESVHPCQSLKVEATFFCGRIINVPSSLVSTLETTEVYCDIFKYLYFS